MIFGLVFGHLKFLHKKTMSMDGERANGVVIAKQNKLGVFLDKATPSERNMMLEEARSCRKRRSFEVTHEKKSAKITKLQKARDQAKY